MITRGDILLSHSGRQHSYKLALSLAKLGRLGHFITSAYYDPSRFPDRLFARSARIDGFLRKRHEKGLSRGVKRFPFFEIPEVLLRMFLGNAKLVSDAVCLRDALFDRFVAKTQIRGSGIFWGFQGSCRESLREAGKKGITSVAEFATAHVTSAVKILTEEREKNPEWADSISNLYFPEWYLKRLEEEPFLADYCVAASGFSRKTLESAGVEAGKIFVLPLGVDIEKFVFKKRKPKYPFQVLFTGSVGQRKGIKYLLDAVNKLNTDKIRLKIIGPVVGSGRAFRRYSGTHEFLGPLSHDEMKKHMHESDCLVLPSLFEGFGLVIPEAMATGMPVIASANTAAPEIIREGLDGFVTEAGDADAISAKLEWLMANREKAVEMGCNARERAEEFSWEKHTERLGALLGTLE